VELLLLFIPPPKDRCVVDYVFMSFIMNLATLYPPYNGTAKTLTPVYKL